MKSTEPPATLPTVVYGGSFNPIHRGHIALGQYLVGHGLAREVWYMVSPQNPLKPPAGLLPDAARLRLARLAVEGLEGLRASDFEFGLPRPSYTVHTLRALRAALPGRKLALLVGADNWVGFRRWYRWEEILDETAVADALRSGKLLAAGMDVLSEEPPRPDNPLLSAPHCFVTPHIAWASLEARTRLLRIAIENVRAFLNGTPQNVVR